MPAVSAGARSGCGSRYDDRVSIIETAVVGALAAGQAREVVTEIYKDAAQPAVREVGAAVGSLIRLAVMPFRAIADGGVLLAQRLVDGAARRLHDRGVAPDKALPPASTIAGQAALNYVLLGEGVEVEALRVLYENMIASAMDPRTAQFVHPAYVHIISQMVPEEVRLLASLPHRSPAIQIRRTRASQTVYTDGGIVSSVSFESTASGEQLERYHQNLIRLGLIVHDFARSIADDEMYVALEVGMKQQEEAENTGKAPAARSTLKSVRGAVIVTALGREFVRLCISEPSPIESDEERSVSTR